MDFGWAIDRLKSGAAVCRRGWNGKGQYIKLQAPDYGSKMKRPYIYICPVDSGLVPWLASQSDMLENDWVNFPDDDAGRVLQTTAPDICCKQNEPCPPH